MRKPVALLAALLFLAPTLGQTLKARPRFVWGGYGVRVDPVDEMEKVLRIVKNGRTRIEIHDYAFKTGLVEITGRPPKELWILAFSGGAHCCFTSYLFTQEEGLKNLLVLFHANAGMEVEDLDGDGRGELVVYEDYAYFGDLCYACSPVAISVYRWDGARFYDATLRFPERTRKKAAAYRRELEEGLRQNAYLDDLKGAALGYWANALRIGEGAKARAWLLSHASAPLRRWLLAHEAEIVSSASPLPRSARRVFSGDEE